MLIFWLKSTQTGWTRYDKAEVEEEGRKTKHKGYKKWKICLQREPLERWGKAVCRGRLTPGAPTPDGETADSSPGK